jgi:signal peptidase I
MELINGLIGFMESTYLSLYSFMGDGLFIALIVFLFIAIVAQWRLYEKANLPGYACLVPVWNVIVFLKIMGRPWQHIFYLLIPFYNIYFLVKIYIELCHCFGKRTIADYILVILFNGFYILSLGLSYEDKYYGPVYSQAQEQKGNNVSNAQLA